MKRLLLATLFFLTPTVWAADDQAGKKVLPSLGWSLDQTLDNTNLGTVTGTNVAFTDLVSCGSLTTDASGNIVCSAAPSGSGDITEVIAGLGLIDGGDNGAVTLNVGEGLAIDAAADSVAFDPTELTGSRTWGDASTDTIVWTWDRATGTDQTLTFQASGIQANQMVTGTQVAMTQHICSNATTSKLLTDANGNLVCGTDQSGAGGGDAITVNSSAATDPDFLDGDVDWTLTGGNSITATVACTGCVDATDLGTNSVSADELNATGVEAELEAALDIDGEVSSTGMATTVLDETGISLTSITIGAILGVDSIDATGAVDMDYGSADVTDHTFITDGGTIILDGSATIEDDLIIGTDLTARAQVDGNADEIQLLIQGNATQTTNLITFENSAGTDQLVLTNAGAATLTGTLTVGGTAQSTITEGLVVNNGSGTDEDDDFTVNVSGAAYEIDAGAGTFTSTANSFGWSVVAGADTACTTTCTSACVFGVNTASLTADIVDCADTTADECLCAGAN